MFAVTNVWADILAILMILAPVGFWGVQIAGNLATGRYYSKFIAKQWPHHNEFISSKPKIMHGINLFSMIALGISGIYLRYPFFGFTKQEPVEVHGLNNHSKNARSRGNGNNGRKFKAKRKTRISRRSK